MQNLRQLSFLTITFLCANYFSTLAQGEQRAFNEGDKVVSIGISGGGGSSGFSTLTPSISFDYGLKGTRGIVSIGGFLSYSNSSYGNQNSYSYSYFSQPITKDSVNYSIMKSSGFNQHTITAGLRFGLHYATRKWDLYAGALVGYRLSLTNSQTQTTDFYKGILPQYGFPSTDGKLLDSKASIYPARTYGQMILSPYVGARYYVTPKISLNLELGQQTGNIGVGFKSLQKK